MEDAQKNKVKGGWLTFWLAVFILGFIAFGIFREFAPSTPAVSQTTANTRMKWARWDNDEDEVPNADVLVRVLEASGSTSYGSSGHIRGGAINNTTKDFSYIQITFGLYSEAGAKFASCLANISSLGSHEIWEFDAYCPEWRSTTKYKVEEVSYF